ncbi:hypothetical protein GC163_06550 [bacterium]|nr:hypothetical protein [bacterium]
MRSYDADRRGLIALLTTLVLMVSLDVTSVQAVAQESDDAVEVAGRSLQDWRRTISELDLQDPASARYVPGLIELMQSAEVPWFTRRQAALTLGRLGPHSVEAIPILVGLLDDTGADPATAPQLWAIKALGLYGPLADSAAPTLVEIYRDDATSHLARLSILDTLSQIGPAHPSAIPCLLSVAGDTTSLSPQPIELRQAAIEALGMVGSAAAISIPVMARALDDHDPITRRLAAETLMRIGVASEIVAPQLLEHLVADESVEVQDAAANALQAIGPLVGPFLQDWLDSDDPVVRARIARIIGGWGKAAHPWARDLHVLWDDADLHVQLAALEASRNVSGPQPELVQRVVKLFTSEDRQIRRRAYLLFERCGDHQAAARDQLELLRHHSEDYVRELAERAFAK